MSAELFTLIGYTDAVQHVAWRSDDTRIVTVSCDGSAKVCDVSAALNTGVGTGAELFTLLHVTSAKANVIHVLDIERGDQVGQIDIRRESGPTDIVVMTVNMDIPTETSGTE